MDTSTRDTPTNTTDDKKIEEPGSKPLTVSNATTSTPVSNAATSTPPHYIHYPPTFSYGAIPIPPPFVHVHHPPSVPEVTEAQKKGITFRFRLDSWIDALIFWINSMAAIIIMVFGGIRFNDCPAEKFIPIGIITFGAIYMVLILLNCVFEMKHVCALSSREQHVPEFLIVINGFLCLSMLGIFFAICYSVYSITPKMKDEDRNSEDYCDYTFFKIVYYLCTVVLLVIHAVVFFLIFLCFCAACCLPFPLFFPFWTP